MMFVLDLSSPALPAGVTGPPVLAFSRTEWGSSSSWPTTLTSISASRAHPSRI